MIISRTNFISNYNLTDEQVRCFDLYAEILLKWQKRINLVSRETLNDVWHRHFADSAQLINQLPDKTVSICDLGSGAGFPALVLIMLGYENTTMIESDLRKTEFLKDVLRRTGKKAEIYNQRIEEVNLQADVVTARALAPLKDLLVYAEPKLYKQGKLLFLKGENYKSEIEDALVGWSFSYTCKPSHTHPESVIIEIINPTRRL